jgi:hypothetical protein
MANNPLHRRVLVNEWIGCHFLRRLGVATPETRTLYVDRDLARTIPLGSAGWHFASRHPGAVATFDVVPDAVLARVANLGDFGGALVADKWMGNTDMRQCIFVRDRVADHVRDADHHPLRKGFVVLMIDQDHVFNGWRWEFTAAPSHSLYFRPLVYRNIVQRDLEPWFDRVRSFPASVAEDAISQIPSTWLGGTDQDRAWLSIVIESLMCRRRRIADLVLDCCRREAHMFSGCATAAAKTYRNQQQSCRDSAVDVDSIAET